MTGFLPCNPPMSFDELASAETWIFDLDNTLYPATCGLFKQVEQNMTRFIMERLEVGRDDAFRIQKAYFQSHGTTMHGLMHHHDVNPEDFLDYVHDIDLAPIPLNPDLEGLLAGLRGRKLVYTNGSTGHAKNITRHMGIDQYFDAVFDIVAADYVPKPEAQAYHRLARDYRINPKTTVMVEDMARNLAPAAAMGMTTVWIETRTPWGRDGAEADFVHHRAPDIVTLLRRVLDI